MSAATNKNSNETTNNRFSFQHFDKEFDFGIINEEGECVRKRKKPGRKSNPPTEQEKRAKNRLAQKVFRERESQRKEENEKQQFMYDQEIQELKSKLAISQFECRYLKACVLHLILDCLIQRGSVPQVWPEARIIPSNNHGEYKNPEFGPYDQQSTINEADQTHALLDVLLENKCIVDFNQAVCRKNIVSDAMRKYGNSGADIVSSTGQAYWGKEVVTLNRNTQDPERILSHGGKKKNSKISPSSVQRNQYVSSPVSSNSTSNSPPSQSQNTQQEDHVLLSPPEQQSVGNNNDYSNMGLVIHQKPVVGVILVPPRLKTLDELSNMPPLQALHILKLQLKLTSILGNLLPAALLPSALQRVIPHDIRIDYVPGAAIRDRMILYQDYYNIDECFQLLTQNTVFMGGDVRDIKNWIVAPQYSLKFWFISHHLDERQYDDSLDEECADFVINEFTKSKNDETGSTVY